MEDKKIRTMQKKEILRFLKYEDIKITFYGEETDEITDSHLCISIKDKTITWCKKLELLSRAGSMTYSLPCATRKAEDRELKNIL